MKKYVITGPGGSGSTFMARMCTATRISTHFGHHTESTPHGNQYHNHHLPWEDSREVANSTFFFDDPAEFFRRHGKDIKEICLCIRRDFALSHRSLRRDGYLGAGNDSDAGWWVSRQENYLRQFEKWAKENDVPLHHFYFPEDMADRERVVSLMVRWGADREVAESAYDEVWNPGQIRTGQ